MESTRRMIRLRIALVAAFAMIAVFAVATRADAHGRHETTLTSGHFVTTQAGIDAGYDIHGTAIMVRRNAGHDGLTTVRVWVRGLDRRTTYPAHVHNGTCASGGGSHYQHEVGGAADAVNEIWPTIRTNRWGIGHGGAVHHHVARPEAQSIVIHDPATGTRLACAQLG